MTVRVLVVDDSRFFRRRVTEILEANPQIKVIDVAENGEEAVKKVASLKPDVVTMDIEMPVMNGISATREIMKNTPTPVLMFSTLTTDGAKSTLDALDAGAADFLPKRFEDISTDRDEAKKLLQERVITLGQKKAPARPAATAKTTLLQSKSTTPAAALSTLPRRAGSSRVDLVAIGTSTGGPVALQEVLLNLPKNFPVPLLLVQHMPGTFTPAFAERLNQICKITIREAKDGDLLEPGTALLAPGGKQMLLKKSGSSLRVSIEESKDNQTYKPSVDLTFSSIASQCNGDVLAIVLTGMGADGREGARELKKKGAMIWAQDEKSSIVYGMPAAIVDAGLADEVLPLNRVGTLLAETLLRQK